VLRNTDGKVEGLRNLEFTALLLNDLQKAGEQLQAHTKQLRLSRQKDSLSGWRSRTGDSSRKREIDALKRQNASIML
jgi:hypothetical protein